MIRTCDLWFRGPTLYPTELRVRQVGKQFKVSGFRFQVSDANGPGRIASSQYQTLGSRAIESRSRIYFAKYPGFVLATSSPRLTSTRTSRHLPSCTDGFEG